MKKNKLHNLKTTGFKTPEHYFEAFEERLFERLEDKESISGIETSGFTLPEDYFDTVEAIIMIQIKTEDKPVIRLKPRTTFYAIAGIAAGVVLVLSLVFNNSKPISIDTVETSFLERYILQESTSFDELASLFETDDISETNFIDFNISEETLDYYLENTDNEDLISN